MIWLTWIETNSKVQNIPKDDTLLLNFEESDLDKQVKIQPFLETSSLNITPPQLRFIGDETQSYLIQV